LRQAWQANTRISLTVTSGAAPWKVMRASHSFRWMNSLLPRQFPTDPKSTKEIRALDLRVHELADQAIDAGTLPERARTYTALLGTCSPCHSLHRNIWGPGRAGGSTR
jgi:hypothetical protein